MSNFIKSAFICLGLLWPSLLFSQTALYDVQRIAPELLEDANAVMRESKVEIEVYSNGKTRTRTREVVTVFNEAGKRHAPMVIIYNKGQKVNIIKAQGYDKSGKPVFKINKSDITDQSATSDGVFAGDSRVKYFSPAWSTYPFTIEYEYETIENNIFFTSVFPHISNGLAIQKAELNVISPPGFDLNIKESFLNKSAEKQSGKKNSIRWTFENIKAFNSESFLPDWRYFTPHVVVAPRKIIHSGYTGDLSSWKEFGKWRAKLIENRDVLPPKSISMLQELVKDKENEREKIKAIYQYMQSRTRYVAIMYGIGGWQPEYASEVDRLGYGECKGLSNYMKAMLKAVGIESHYTVVFSGKNKRFFHTDLVTNMFNHVMLCVPNNGDTIWLECTDQQIPFGFLGNHTDNRPVLLITDEGGVLAKTPKYCKDVNVATSTSHITLREDGNASLALSMKLKGLEFDDYFGIMTLSSSDQKRALSSILPFNDFSIQTHSFQWTKDAPEATFLLEAELKNMGTRNGTRLMVNLQTMNSFKQAPARARNRQHPFEISMEFTNSDTLLISIPKGYSPQLFQTSTVEDARFGKYESRMDLTDGKIRYIRNMERNSGIFPAELYNEFVEFMQKIVLADKRQLILVKE